MSRLQPFQVRPGAPGLAGFETWVGSRNYQHPRLENRQTWGTSATALRHLLLGEHDKERSFAYLGQADDSGFHELAISCQRLAVSCDILLFSISQLSFVGRLKVLHGKNTSGFCRDPALFPEA